MKKIKRKMTTKQGVLIFALLFVLFYIIIYIIPTVSDIFTQTYIAEYGTLKVDREAECVIVRDEQVYKASGSGSVDKEVEAGQLVKANRHIVSVGNTAMYNDSVGIVSYYYDGYEGKVNSETMTDLTESFIKEFKDSEGVKKTAKSAESGDVVFKIIDNTNWYLVFWMDTEDAEVFKAGNKVTVDFGNQEDLLMRVKSITEQDDKMQVILKCNRTYEAFDQYRIKECTITAKSSSGIILNTDSIVEVDGTKGVYVIDKYGKENFTPVQIYYTQGNKTVVAKNYYYDSEGYPVETVKNYDEIVK